MLSVLCALALSPSKPLNILFLGNSHTGFHDLTGMVEQLLESDGTHRQVRKTVYMGAFLGDFALRKDVLAEFSSGRWTHIVLQGTKMSSSHKYKYSQDTAIQVCKAAVASGATVLLFPEWPRRGWNESEWILNHYRRLAAESGAKVVPIPYCWDAAIRAQPQLDLWQPDGNHSSPTGAFLAASGFYYAIAGKRREPAWRPSWMTERDAGRLLSYATVVLKKGTD